MSAPVESPFLSRTEAAEFLRVSPAMLSADAVTQRHQIPFTKIGRRVVYNRLALQAWAESQVPARFKRPTAIGVPHEIPEAAAQSYDDAQDRAGNGRPLGTSH